MILQALVDHYECLARQGKIASLGWGAVKVSYALCIAADGSLEQAVCLKTEQTRGKKKALLPQEMLLPAPVKRTSGILANFMCDNTTYVLGIDNKGKKEKAINCFEAMKALHESLLGDVSTPAAQALLAFFRTWDPETAASHPALQDCLEDMYGGANLVFRFESRYVHEDSEIREKWNQHYASVGEGPEMVCLITGKKGPAEAVHPAIKGVKDAQSSGASLISFNAPAFCSYGKEQNLNAPVGQYATFAYTTALNHLLADRDHVAFLGDATVVCWAKEGNSAYQDLMGFYGFGQERQYDGHDINTLVKKLCAGEQVRFQDSQLDPEMDFYILGLAPNASRLSVRFFLKNSFGTFLRNVQKHHQRMEIIRPKNDKFESVPLWKMLGETVNQKSQTKTPAPNLSGETLRSILADSPYPALLLQGVLLRIRADQSVTRGRAAIIKAYYLKRNHQDIPKEVLTVSLNPDSTCVPYTLGRLFSVLENIQSAANPGINTTIKDRYFNSASATPAHVFPTLINLAQKHLKKLSAGLSISLDKQLTELLAKLGEAYPKHLSIPEQGAFQLGYYHQTQARYQNKQTTEEK